MSYVSKLQMISAILRPELCESWEQEIVLREKREPQRNPVILAISSGQQAIVLSFEHCIKQLGVKDLPTWLFPLFQSAESIRKSCDYVIFCEEEDNVCVLLIELKGRHMESANKQLANTRLLIDWILDVAEYQAAGAFNTSHRTHTRSYHGVVFMENKPRPKGEIPYIPHPQMPDLRIVALPYQKFFLKSLWKKPQP